MKWISVEERPPEKNGWYPVVINNRNGQFEDCSWWDIEDGWDDPDITHWFQLPPLPKLSTTERLKEQGK